MTDAPKSKLLDTIWIMRTADGWYPIQPSENCKPEDHGRLNVHIVSIEDVNGKILWQRNLH
jgi:hypothetical protein